MNVVPVINGRQVLITPYARSRMSQRSISEAEVYLVLQTRGIDVPAKQGRRNIFDTINGRRIRVTVEEGQGYTTVITVCAP